MMKKVLAITLALIVMLQPMTASAVTWCNLVSGLRAAQKTAGSGNASVTIDGTTATSYQNSSDAISIAISGGSILFEGHWDEEGGPGYDFVTNWVSTDEYETSFEETYYTFSDVNIDLGTLGYFDVYATDGNFVGVMLEDDAVGAYSIYLYSYDGSHVELIGGEDDAQVYFGNYNGGTGVIHNQNMDTTVGIDVYGEASPDAAADALNTFFAANGDGVNPDTAWVYFLGEEDYLGDALIFYDEESGAYVVEAVWNGTGDVIYQNPESVGGSGEGEAEEMPIDWDAVYEQMREADEAKRQAAAVGGVTTSIYPNYQAYLGHSCYNFRIFHEGGKVVSNQSLAWLPGGSAVGKNHIFQIYPAVEDLSTVEIRVAQDYLDVCQRAGVAMITIMDGYENVLAQYSVADLMAVRENYGLAADEQLCVSADPNAEVMKVTAEGEYVPLEPETEEAAAEETAAA